MAYRVAVVGATGAVGREIIKTLVERNFPASEVIALASARSVGAEISFGATGFFLRAGDSEAIVSAVGAETGAGVTISGSFGAAFSLREIFAAGVGAELTGVGVGVEGETLVGGLLPAELLAMRNARAYLINSRGRAGKFFTFRRGAWLTAT